MGEKKEDNKPKPLHENLQEKNAASPHSPKNLKKEGRDLEKKTKFSEKEKTPPHLESDSSEFEKVKKDLAQTRQNLLYLRAEFENYRKNVTKERTEGIKYGSQPLISALLNVADLFDQALMAELKQDNLKSFKKGMAMIFSEFKNTLQNFGLKEVSLEKGTSFNPREHEALSHKDSQDIPPDHIIEVYRKTYKLYDRVIRPAQVVVSSGIQQKKSSQSETPSKNTGTTKNTGLKKEKTEEE